MRTRYISTTKEIEIWVDEQMGSSTPDEGDKEKLVSAILALDHPLFGTDWQGFFESLPDDIYKLPTISFNQGYESFKQDDVTINPYLSNTIEFKQWNAGRCCAMNQEIAD